MLYVRSKLARVFLRFDYLARCIVNANDGIMSAANESGLLSLDTNQYFR
jgi:hypothetical protein